MTPIDKKSVPLPHRRNRVNKLSHSFLLISWVFSLVCRDENKLFYDRKKIAKLEEESIIVGKTFKTAKSAGDKKLRLRTAEIVASLNEKRISQITTKKLCYKVHIARFKNKAVPCPVQAKHVQSQHQVDLVDMRKCPVDGKGSCTNIFFNSWMFLADNTGWSP